MLFRSKYFLVLFIVYALLSSDRIGQAQTIISSYSLSSFNPANGSYTATSPSDASGDIDPNTNYELRFGRGTDYTLNSYAIGGSTYSNFIQPDTLAIRRTDASVFVNIWHSLIGIDPVLILVNPVADINIDVPFTTNANEIYKSNTLLAGYDNILVNEDDQASGSIQAQVERVDAIWYDGIVSCAPENAVFPIIERGGNDSIKIAAITSLDSQGNPASYSDMVEVVDADWPGTGPSELTHDEYIILRYQSPEENALPLLTIGSQIIQGVAVSFNELGIASGQIIYGYSLFAFDTDDASHDLTDITTFPTNTLASASGLDLVASTAAAVSSDNCLTVARGPGGYHQSLATWLKADDTDDVTTSTEGASVTDWQDHWRGNNDFTTDGTAPVYRSTSSTLNFNPTVDFTSTDRGLTTPNNSDFNTSTFFTRKGLSLVFRTNSSDVSTRQVIFEQGSATRGLNIYLESDVIHVSAWNDSNDGAGAPWNSGISTLSQSVSMDTEYILTLELNGNSSTTGNLIAYLNGQSMGTLSNVGLLYSDTGDITLGRSGGSSRYSTGTTDSNSNSFKGEISELIYRNEPSSFSVAERKRLESYLAIKYGVALDQSTPINYVNSNGAIIFNATNNASSGGFLEYNKKVAGIGRDDNSEFDKKDSKSERNNAIINVNKNGAFNSNNTWLVWGHDDGDADDLTDAADYPAIISNRIDRIWRVSETNDCGNISISFDLSQITFNNSPSASDLSLLIAGSTSLGIFTNATIVTGGVLDSNVITFSNVDIEDGQFFTLGTGYIDCAPAGVTSDLSLWLKADLGTNSTSGEITQWDDLASGNNATGTGGSVPDYLPNAINFNPALDFNGSSEFMSASAGFHSTAYFLVLLPDDNFTSASSVQIPLGWDDSSVTTTNSLGGFFFGNTYDGVNDIIGHIVGSGATSYTSFEDNASKTISSGIPLIFGTIDNAASSPTNSITFQNGSQITNSSAGTLLSLSNEEFALGRFETPNDLALTNFFDGKIAEVISYSSRPSLAQSEQINSYLAIKYGITLSHNYSSSSGSTLWNVTTNASYNNNVAGIGRDDDSCLEQKQSKSSNSGSIVSMGNGGIFSNNSSNPNSFAINQSFLIWGNDGDDASQTNANTSDLPGNVTERIETIWKVAKTGTIENTTVSFDLSGLGYSSNASDLQLIVSSSVTMASGSTITGGTFEGDILKFNNIEFSDGDFFTLGTDRTTCNPGGISTDLALWLKANEGTNTISDNANITSWSDFSGNNRNGIEQDLGGGNPVEPTYQSNQINYNPAIEFSDPNSTNSSYIETSNGNSVDGDFTIVAVFQSGQSGGDSEDFENAPILVGAGTSASDLDYGLGLAAGRIHLNASSDDNLTVRSTDGTTYIDLEPYIVTATRVQASGDVALYINSATDETATGTTGSLTSPSSFGIGNNPSPTVGSQFSGRIGEVLVFADDLSTSERQRVETYLAIKYGISRNTSDNYLASDGGIIWNYSANSQFNNDIAGIGRDDNSCLSQLKSKSENNDAIVSIETASFASDDSFLIWGNDDADIENTNNSEYNSSQVESRLNREWFVQESGTIGAVTVTFDLAEITGPSGTGTNNLNSLRLMVDGDGDFSSGVTLVSPSSINSSEKTASFTTNLNNGEYFTLGSEEVGALPLDLIAFDAQALESNNVKLEWTTASEDKFVYFGIERSQDGINFHNIETIERTGGLTEVSDYHFLDRTPVGGQSFYRLKHVSPEGTVEYSHIEKVFINKTNPQGLSIYPNPITKGSQVQLTYKVDESQNLNISIYDTKGTLQYNISKTISPRNTVVAINTNNLPHGLNILRVTNGQQLIQTVKLIVH